MFLHWRGRRSKLERATLTSHKICPTTKRSLRMCSEVQECCHMPVNMELEDGKVAQESLANLGIKIQARMKLLSAFESTVGQVERFDLWATNLGLYQSGQYDSLVTFQIVEANKPSFQLIGASLDYRFRDAPLVFDFAYKLLEDLDNVLDLVEEGVSPVNSDPSSLLDKEPSSVATKLEQISETNNTLEVFDSDSDDEDIYSSYNERPTLQIGLERLESIIDRLYRLSFKIRNPSTRIGFSKATSYSDVDVLTGVNLIERYAEFDLSHVWEHFHRYDGLERDQLDDHYLVQRLARANTRRRQQFGQWKHHRNKLRGAKAKANQDLPSGDRLAVQSAEPARPTIDVLKTEIEPSRPSTATRVEDIHIDVDDTVSITSTSTYAIGSGDSNQLEVAIPKLPPEIKNKKEIECPYCYILCSKRTTQTKLWERHLMKDLRPYICTFDNCPSADQMYDSIRDWIGHESRVHGECVRTKCPICNDPPNVHHIASHLRALALFSLPRSTGLENEAYEADSDNAAGTAVSQDSDLSSLSFSSKDSRDSHSTAADLNHPSYLGYVLTSSDSPWKESSLVQTTLQTNNTQTALHDFVLVAKQKGHNPNKGMGVNDLKEKQLFHLVKERNLQETDPDFEWKLAVVSIQVPDRTYNRVLYDEITPTPPFSTMEVILERFRRPKIKPIKINPRLFKSIAMKVIQRLRAQRAIKDATGHLVFHFPSGLREAEAMSAIRQLCENGDEKGLMLPLSLLGARQLLTQGKFENGDTPLMIACAYGRLSVVEYLISRGAYVDTGGGQYGFPLQAASFHGEEHVVTSLLDRHAQVNNCGGPYGCALGAAAYRGHFKIIKHLLNHGADVNLYTGDLESTHVMSPLYAAAMGGQLDIVQVLLDSGADPTQSDTEFGSPLIPPAGDGNLEIVKRLVNHGADVNVRSLRLGTALGLACKEGHLNIIDYLLERGAETDIPSGDREHQYTVLEIACCYSQVNVVSLLLAKGAVVDARNGWNRNVGNILWSTGNERLLAIVVKDMMNRISSGFEGEVVMERLGIKLDSASLSRIESLLDQ